MEEVDTFFNLPAKEEEPFKEKYLGRAKLEDFLKAYTFTENYQDSIIKAIIYSHLGKNFMACEENASA